MLSECSSRLNQPNHNAHNLDPRSPYLMQLKTFEDRLKKQNNPRFHSTTKIHSQKHKSNAFKNDYIHIVKNFLEKNENINIFEDVPYQSTEPSIDSSTDTTIHKIKRKIDDRKTVKTEKCRRRQIWDSDTCSNQTDHILDSRERVKSQAQWNLVGNKSFMVKEKGMTFIRYKKNKNIIENGKNI